MKTLIVFLISLLSILNMSAQKKETIIIGEDFDGMTDYKWPISTAEGKSAVIKDGNYKINITEDKITGFLTIPALIDEKKDYNIKMKINSLTNTEKSFYGIVWGAASKKDCFLFLIDSKQGMWTVAKMTQGKYTVILPWSKCDNLKTDGKANELSIIVMDNYWYFNINNKAIKKAPIETFMGNKIGIFSDGKVQINVDEFYVSVIK